MMRINIIDILCGLEKSAVPELCEWTDVTTENKNIELETLNFMSFHHFEILIVQNININFQLSGTAYNCVQTINKFKKRMKKKSKIIVAHVK